MVFAKGAFLTFPFPTTFPENKMAQAGTCTMVTAQVILTRFGVRTFDVFSTTLNGGLL